MIGECIYITTSGKGGGCTDPSSKEICGCGVFLGRSGSRGNTCRQLVQSYQCTAARRATLHTRPRLQGEGEEADGITTSTNICFLVVLNINHYYEGIMQEGQLLFENTVSIPADPSFQFVRFLPTHE